MRAAKFIPPLLMLALFLFAWHGLSVFFAHGFLPSPLGVMYGTIEIINEEVFWSSLLLTIQRVCAGFLLALFLGASIGVLIGLYKNLEIAFKPYLIVALTIPALCWTTISILLFGIGEWTAIFSISVIVAPFITVNILSGMKALDPSLQQMAKAFNMEPSTIYKKIIYPQLMPYFISTIRYGVALSWKVVVIVEMLGLSSGVGYQISFWFNMFSMEKVIGWTLLFTSFMFFIEYAIIRPYEVHTNSWRGNS